MTQEEREEDQNLAQKPKPQETPKFCPLIGKDCQKESCALWVTRYRPHLDPTKLYTSLGCGLIARPSWSIKTIEQR